MYKLLLIQRYLRRKLAPLFAALAVTLCTAMVIIVISVMGGFLEMLQEAIGKMTPEVTVVGLSVGGFGHYEDLVRRIEDLPEVDRATPVIRTLGIVRWRGVKTDVQLLGVRPRELQSIVAFKHSIYWRTSMFRKDIDKRLAKGSDLSEMKRQMLERKRSKLDDQNFVNDALNFRPNPFWTGSPKAAKRPGAVPGIAVLPVERRDAAGKYRLSQHAMGDELTIGVLPIDRSGGALEPVVRRFTIANEFKSGHYEYDSKLVFVPFKQLQSMLKMDPAPKVNPRTGKPIGQMSSARANAVFVSSANGVELGDLVSAVKKTLGDFSSQYKNLPPLTTQTWIEQNRVLLSAVENEKDMVTFLFVIISFVAVWMVWLTFYNIVLQKTRDIGVLRAIGASRSGVLSVFLGYGLTLGILGAVLGLGLAALIIFNLNEIQALLKATIGWQMWDPRVYAFDHIPEQMNPVECTVIVLAAIASSTIGALVPSVMAASVDPIEALRHE